jgi:hypothetical protein
MDQVYIFCEKQEDRHQLPQHLNSNDIECMTPGVRQDFDYLSPDVIVPMANVAITLLNVILMYIQKKHNRKIVIKGEKGWQVELPANCSEKQLEKYVEMAVHNKSRKIIIAANNN